MTLAATEMRVIASQQCIHQRYHAGPSLALALALALVPSAKDCAEGGGVEWSGKECGEGRAD